VGLESSPAAVVVATPEGVIFDPKNAGGSLGTARLAFREKGCLLRPKKAGGGLGTAQMAFKEKRGRILGPRKLPEAAFYEKSKYRG